MTVLICGSVIVQGSISASGQQPPEPSSISQGGGGSQSLIFGCTQYYPNIHCDPIRNIFESWTTVYDLTRIASTDIDPTFVAGKFNKAIAIKAEERNFLRMQQGGKYDLEAMTLYLSVRVENPDNFSGELVSYTDQFHYAGWGIEAVGSETGEKFVRVTLFNGTTNDLISPPIKVPSDQFLQIAATVDGNRLRVYLNGALAAETRNEDFVYSPVNATLTVGSGAWCSCRTLTAAYDELRIYSRTLSEQEIVAINTPADAARETEPNPFLFGGILVPKSKPPELVGQWTFDGDLKDRSASHNDARIYSLISGMTFTPDGRLLFNEKNTGKIRVMDSAGNVSPRPFFEVNDVFVGWEEGLLSIETHPDFLENRFVYFTYNYEDRNTKEIYLRLARVTDRDGIGTDFTLVFDKIMTSRGYHSGGAFTFDPTDKTIYLVVGDGTQHEKAQDLSTYLGKVLRINSDGTVPSDNPFPGSAIYSYGHRNAYGLAFDPNRLGILGESGAELYDEVNLLSPGANYGWPTLQPPNIAPEWFTNDTSEKPIRSYMQTPTFTQTIFYKGELYPTLTNTFVLGLFTGDLYSLSIDPNTRLLKEELRIELGIFPYEPVIGVAQSPAGEIYVAGYHIYKLGGPRLDEPQKSMFPIIINTTNIDVASVGYQKSDDSFSISLADRAGPSSVTAEISASSVDSDTQYSTLTALANDGETIVALPHTVTISGIRNSTVLSVTLPDDYSAGDELKLIVSKGSVSVTKAVPEFQPLVAVLMLVAIFAVVIGRNILIKNAH